MDMKEKLVELILSTDLSLSYSRESDALNIADVLIAHGVTVQDKTEISDELLEQLRNAPITILHEEPTVEVVQEWISVKDRLPETNGFRVWVVACVDGKKSCIRLFERTTVRGKLVERFKYPWETITYENITHWMPLPEPPKGE